MQTGNGRANEKKHASRRASLVSPADSRHPRGPGQCVRRADPSRHAGGAHRVLVRNPLMGGGDRSIRVSDLIAAEDPIDALDETCGHALDRQMPDGRPGLRSKSVPRQVI